MAKQTIQISKELVEKLKEVAKTSKRSLNSEAEYGLTKHVEASTKK